jgi:hypothetical protein
MISLTYPSTVFPVGSAAFLIHGVGLFGGAIFPGPLK